MCEPLRVAQVRQGHRCKWLHLGVIEAIRAQEICSGARIHHRLSLSRHATIYVAPACTIWKSPLILIYRRQCITPNISYTFTWSDYIIWSLAVAQKWPFVFQPKNILYSVVRARSLLWVRRLLSEPHGPNTNRSRTGLLFQRADLVCWFVRFQTHTLDSICIIRNLVQAHLYSILNLWLQTI